MVRRLAIFGMIATLAATGCNAGNSGGLKRSEPPMARETLSKARVIEQINKNSAAIEALSAFPSIVAAGGGQSGHLDGKLAMDRPRDFRFIVEFHSRPQADIGSNQQGFWFWVKDDSSKALYVCDYANANANPLSVTMQPDWIMEAMGLREINDREAQTIQATKGDKPGQLILTQLRNDPKGGALTKVTVVNESTGEILEHQLYSGAKEKLLARATISQTQHIAIKPDGSSESLVNFPAKLKLEWVAENFSLDITMGKTLINPTFAKADRLVLFSEPTIKGAVKTDLAKLNKNPASATSRIYESAPRSGIRLGNPEIDAFGTEGASLTPPSNARSPLIADRDTMPPLPSSYVGPQVPRAPDSETVPASLNSGSYRGTFR